MFITSKATCFLNFFVAVVLVVSLFEPLLEKNRGLISQWCGQPLQIIHILGWMGTGGLGMCAWWRLPVAPLYADVELKGHVSCPLIHDSLLRLGVKYKA